MLITACLLPGLAPEKTKPGSVSFLKGEKHTQKMLHCCVGCWRVLLETRLAVLSSLPLLANPSIKYLRQPLPA